LPIILRQNVGWLEINFEDKLFGQVLARRGGPFARGLALRTPTRHCKDRHAEPRDYKARIGDRSRNILEERHQGVLLRGATKRRKDHAEGYVPDATDRLATAPRVILIQTPIQQITVSVPMQDFHGNLDGDD
jgi:hypothetical protein